MANGTRTHALNLVRGGLMGTAEVIPGVSGGTVALITGMYDQLISAVGHFVSGARLLVTDVPRGQGTERARGEFRRVDWPFVVCVVVGMLSMLVIAAQVVAPLVEDHPQRSYALFFGLVLASIYIPYTQSGRTWSGLDYALAGACAVAAFFVFGMPPSEVEDPAPWMIVGVAAIAVCALAMPGLSGSFLLVGFGMYTVTLNALNDRDLGYIGLFALGAVLGLSVFVKLLQWLLEHHHHITLVVMTGLLVGSLRALWPYQPWDDGDSRDLRAPDGDYLATFGLMAVGFALVVVMLVAARRAATKRKPQLVP
ncbi:putative membrane protein [Rhodococcus triatomae]|uniref:Putative membrane protein n=1 Tax=Rhodococcus triatomae TaxID=300028 RepID=A0A1G8A9W3_9NOCA|nr:DUF368 domain-containing protein [Rhodococcus triatomae]SDH17718.1 putative membrane protein [Rhodococcus triatomae]